MTTPPLTPILSLPLSNATQRQIAERVNQIIKNFPQFGGGDYRGIATATGAYPVAPSDFTILADCSATTTVVITLPAVALSAWRVLNCKKIDPSANTMKITGDANIDGVAAKTSTTQYQNFQLQSDGTLWYVL